MKTEYQVRPVTRFIVTRYAVSTTNAEKSLNAGRSSVVGEFDSGKQADTVAAAMVEADKVLGIDSSMSRHGLSMGEVISGQRLEDK